MGQGSSEGRGFTNSEEQYTSGPRVGAGEKTGVGVPQSVSHQEVSVPRYRSTSEGV